MLQQNVVANHISWHILVLDMKWEHVTSYLLHWSRIMCRKEGSGHHLGIGHQENNRSKANQEQQKNTSRNNTSSNHSAKRGQNPHLMDRSFPLLYIYIGKKISTHSAKPTIYALKACILLDTLLWNYISISSQTLLHWKFID